jgi:hypothetical protein
MNASLVCRQTASARVREHDAKDPRPTPLAVDANHRRAAAEIDLGLFAWQRLQPPAGQLDALAEPSHVAPHAPILAREAVLIDQVLMDSLGRQAGLELGLDDRPE